MPYERPDPSSPTRPRSRASDYTLDLSALPTSHPLYETSKSETTAPTSQPTVPVKQFDSLRTDDIDGPSDFTQNLESYIRGSRLPTVFKPTRAEGQRREDLEEYVSSDDDFDSSMMTGKVETPTKRSKGFATSTPMPRAGEEEEEDEETSAIVKDVKESEKVQDIDGDRESEVESQYTVEHHEMVASPIDHVPDTDGQAETNSSPSIQATPAPKPKSKRHAFVEDYVDTPPPPRSTRSASSSAIGNTLRKIKGGHKSSPMKTQEAGQNSPPTSKTIQSLERTIQNLRHELQSVESKHQLQMDMLQRQHDSQINKHSDLLKKITKQHAEERGSFEKQLQELRSGLEKECVTSEDLRTKNSDLDVELALAQSRLHELREHFTGIEDKLERTVEERDAAKRAHKAEEAQLESLRQSSLSHEQEMAQLIDTRDKEYEKYQVSLKAVEDLLGTRDKDLAQLRAQLDTAASDLEHAAERSILRRAELEGSTSSQEQKQELESLRGRFESKTTALNAEVAYLQSELQSSNQTVTRLTLELDRKTEAMRVMAEEQAEEQRLAHEALDRAKGRSLKEAEEKRVELREEIERLTSSHEVRLMKVLDGHTVELEQVRARGEEAVRRAAEIVRKEKAAAKDANERLASLEEELGDLRNEILLNSDRIEDLQREKDEFKEKFERKREELRAAKVAAEAEVEAVKLEMQTMREDHRAVNEAMDKRLIQMVKKREAELNHKMQTAKREQKKLGKVLMREWGRGEMGVGKPQAYQYQFVDEM